MKTIHSYKNRSIPLFACNLTDFPFPKRSYYVGFRIFFFNLKQKPLDSRLQCEQLKSPKGKMNTSVQMVRQDLSKTGKSTTY